MFAYRDGVGKGNGFMTQEVVIVSAVRTAIGAFQGTLKDIAAPTLGSIFY